MTTPSPLTIQRSFLGVYTVKDNATQKTEQPKDLYAFLTDYLTTHSDLTQNQLLALRDEVRKCASKAITTKVLGSGSIEPSLNLLSRKISNLRAQALPPPRPRTVSRAEERKSAVLAANQELIQEIQTPSSSSQPKVTFQEETSPATPSRPGTPVVKKVNFKEIEENPSPVSFKEFQGALKTEAKYICRSHAHSDPEVAAWLANLMEQSFTEAVQKHQNGEITHKQIRIETYKILKEKIKNENQIKEIGTPEMFKFLLGVAAKAFGFEITSNQPPLIDPKSQQTIALAKAIQTGEWETDEERSFDLTHLIPPYDEKVPEKLSSFFHSSLAKRAFKQLTL